MERISLPPGCGSSWTDRQWLWTHAVPGAQPSPSPAVDALGPRAAAAEQPLIVLSTHLSRCGTRQLHPGATDLWLNPNILISPHRASWGAPAITQVQGTCLQSTQEGRNQPKVPDQRQGLLWRTPGLTHPGPVNSPPPVPSLLGHCFRAQPAPLLCRDASELGLPHHRAQPLHAHHPADTQRRTEIRKKLYLQRKY